MIAVIEQTADGRHVVKVTWERWQKEAAKGPEVRVTWELIFPNDIRIDNPIPVLQGPLSCIRIDTGEVVDLDDDEIKEMRQRAAEEVLLSAMPEDPDDWTP